MDVDLDRCLVSFTHKYRLSLFALYCRTFALSYFDDMFLCCRGLPDTLLYYVGCGGSSTVLHGVGTWTVC